MAGRWLMRDASYYNYVNRTSNAGLPIVSGTAVKFTDTGFTTLINTWTDDSFVSIPISSLYYFNFFGTNYGSNAAGVIQNLGINWNTNNVLMFGTRIGSPIIWDANTGKGILIGNYDRAVNNCSYQLINSTSPTGYQILKFYNKYQNRYTDGQLNPHNSELQIRLISSSNNTSNQAIEVRFNVLPASNNTGGFNITNGTTFQNTFGGALPYFTNTSFVLQSNPTGNNWVFYNNSYVNIT